MATIELFFDIVSPYSYLAWQRRADIRSAGHTLVPRPILLGGLFAEAGNRMPAEVPAKAAWMLGDLQANARRLGVPFVMNSAFPFRSVGSLRLLLAAAAAGSSDLAERLATRLFDLAWARDGAPDDPATQATILAEERGDAALLVAATAEPARAALRAATAEAVQRGAFGAPTFFVGDRMYWGHDRIDLMLHELGG